MIQTTLVAILMAGAALIFGWAPAGLVTLPDMGASTEPWRQLSGHLVHTDWQHMLMNLAGLTACGLLFERRSADQSGPMPAVHFSTLLLAGMVAVSIWLAWYSDLTAYCGLSGALNALFTGGCLLRYQTSRPTGRPCYTPGTHLVFLLLPLLGLLKIAYETGQESAMITASAWPSATGAHLAGWLAGVAYFVALRSWHYRKSLFGQLHLPMFSGKIRLD